MCFFPSVPCSVLAIASDLLIQDFLVMPYGSAIGVMLGTI